MTRMAHLFSEFLNLFLPSRCPVCQGRSDRHAINPICSTCWETIGPYRGSACRRCGLPTISEATLSCASCVRDEPPYSVVLCYGIYEGVLREAIHAFKFRGVKRLARPLGHLMSGLPVPEADAVLPVPLHPARLREREFNQSALLGRRISLQTGIPLMLGALEKVRETVPQTDVPGKERAKNVRKAFRASEKVAGKRIVLVDDVITTGATTNECAATLRSAGAGEVIVVALARSMPKI